MKLKCCKCRRTKDASKFYRGGYWCKRCILARAKRLSAAARKERERQRRSA